MTSRSPEQRAARGVVGLTEVSDVLMTWHDALAHGWKNQQGIGSTRYMWGVFHILDLRGMGGKKTRWVKNCDFL